ncbi:MAG: hypothetical protein ACLQVD_20555 [Capsulimonadaceae bacterium]
MNPQQIDDCLAIHRDGTWRKCDGDDLRALPHDLFEAGRMSDLRQLLLSYDWIRAMVERGRVVELVADYDLILSRDPADSALSTVQAALRLSSQAVTAAPRQLPSQLTGRLSDQPEAEIVALLADAARLTDHAWLRPVKTCLTSPDRPLRMILEGHTGHVECVAVSPDGRFAVSGATDNTMRVWDLATGTTLRTLEGHSNYVYSVVISADGRRVLSGSWDDTVRLWDLETGVARLTLEGHTASVCAVALSPDGRIAASGSMDRTARVWNLETGTTVQVLKGHTSHVTCVAFFAGGRRVVTGSVDRTMRVWDLWDSKVVHVLTGHTEQVTGVAMLADGKRAVSTSWDRTVRVWNLETGKCEATSDYRGFATLSADGRYARSGANVWDVESGKACGTLEGNTAFVHCFALFQDGRRAISGWQDNTLRVWNMAAKAQAPAEARPGFTRISMSADGAVAVSTGAAAQDNTLRVWNPGTGTVVRTLSGHVGRVKSVDMSADGRLAISGAVDGTLRVWNVDSGESVRSLPGWGLALALSADGRRALSDSGHLTVRVWNIETGEPMGTLTYTRSLMCIALSGDGRTAILESEEVADLAVWDVESGKTVGQLSGHRGYDLDLVLTMDGSRAVSTAEDNKVRVWDVPSGELLQAWDAGPVRCVALIADGNRVVSGASDRTLRVWDFATGECLLEFLADDAVVDCAVAEGGRLAFTDQAGRVGFLQVEHDTRQ